MYIDVVWFTVVVIGGYEFVWLLVFLILSGARVVGFIVVNIVGVLPYCGLDVVGSNLVVVS